MRHFSYYHIIHNAENMKDMKSVKRMKNMKNMKKILYELKCIEKGLERGKEKNGLWGKEISNPWLYKQYIEKKNILNNLHNIIKNYYDLASYFEGKKKKKTFFDINKNAFLDKFGNRNKRWISEIERKQMEEEKKMFKLKMERRKLIHNKYKYEIKKVIRMDKTINTFKNVTKQVYSSCRRNNKMENWRAKKKRAKKGKIFTAKMKKKKILINIEKNLIFNNLILEIYKFTHSICHITNDNTFGWKVNPNSRQLKDNSMGNIKYGKEKECAFPSDNKSYEEIDGKNEKPLSATILEVLFKNSIELIGKAENNMGNNNNLLIKKIDNNLLYIIDSDIMLTKIMVYFDLIDIFISYFLFISNCINKEVIYYVNIFIIIIEQFRNKFSLLSKTIIENKNIFTIFFLFSNSIKKNILNNETSMCRYFNFEKKTEWDNTNLFNNKYEKGNKCFLNDVKEIYLNWMYSYDKGESSKIENEDSKNEQVGNLANEDDISKERIKKTVFNKLQTSVGSDEISYSRKNILYEKNNNIKDEPENVTHGHDNLNIIKLINSMSSKNKDMIEKDFNYIIINDERESDCVNMALNIHEEDKENIKFYKGYIKEHICNFFENKYNLKKIQNNNYNKLKENNIKKNTVKNHVSLFENYKNIFHKFF
ncbi:conserved Plasmodium protein, unknown function [Plasmodium chabaudi chabaudi]|uniref:Uncharacterized protein n=1 Tax=Plasmodium chabaudi chabaudi TaxID=31271 RepID=A0A4V0K667_PLACU|nr:conserved Plasmodium protein, unknown function [Plasmodium chabaudi chabaudi]VTZ68513.1 conserved Plasmodium protein, unknown function [Plasmodium chabaudi chabaudi]|eukprot:XP_732641.2 conserved Plasmodium protein, unknown function [Plasmodium chabaudi chabaudi]